MLPTSPYLAAHACAEPTDDVEETLWWRAGRATGLGGDARQRNQMLGLTGYGLSLSPVLLSRAAEYPVIDSSSTGWPSATAYHQAHLQADLLACGLRGHLQGEPSLPLSRGRAHVQRSGRTCLSELPPWHRDVPAWSAHCHARLPSSSPSWLVRTPWQVHCSPIWTTADEQRQTG